MPIDRAENQDAADHRGPRRDGGPCQRVLDGPGGVRRSGDTPGKRAGKAIDEVARTLAGQMIEQVETNVAADRHEGMRRHPAGESPEKIVPRHQREQQHDRAPQCVSRRVLSAQHVHQVLDGVLRADCADHGCEDRAQHDGMTEDAAPDIVCEEADRSLGCISWRGFRHRPLFIANRYYRQTGERCQSLSVSADTVGAGLRDLHHFIHTLHRVFETMEGMNIGPSTAIRAIGSGQVRAARPHVRLDTSLELLLERAPATEMHRVLATVVATAGSTYRKPGARMLIMADGSYLGLLSGGCLEADLKLHAQEVLDSGVPRAIEYDMRGPDDILFGIGAGCEGAMRVLLEPAGPGSPAAAALATAGRETRAGRPTALVSVHESADVPLGTYDDAAPSLPS